MTHLTCRSRRGLWSSERNMSNYSSRKLELPTTKWSESDLCIFACSRAEGSQLMSELQQFNDTNYVWNEAITQFICILVFLCVCAFVCVNVCLCREKPSLLISPSLLITNANARQIRLHDSSHSPLWCIVGVANSMKANINYLQTPIASLYRRRRGKAKHFSPPYKHRLSSREDKHNNEKDRSLTQYQPAG